MRFSLPSQPAATLLCILLADDDEDDCLLFNDAVNELDASSQLTCVDNGEKLMQFLSDTQQLTEILFHDLNMPRKNGLECLRGKKPLKGLKAFLSLYSPPHLN